MAQWRKTFDSLGGPTYIADPRVDEQARLGELLLARQRVQGEQQDRLFGRRQQADSLGESKRQFDAELAQRQLEARQRLELQSGEATRAQANADRAFGLDSQQADLAKQRLAQQDEQAFREQAARDSVFYANREDEKRRQLEADVNRIDVNARANEAERRADKRLAQQNAVDDRRETGRDARQAAREKAAADRQEATLTAAEERQRAQIEAQARLAQERETRLRDQDRQDREDERVKTEGTETDQRKWAIDARAARFRQALEAATGGKQGSMSEADQAKAVQQAYRLAVQPSDLDPQRQIRERALGPEGEAAANAELRAITAEFFPQQDYVASTGDWINGPGDVATAMFALPALAAQHPDYLNKNDYARAFATWLARKVDGGAGVDRRSAAQNEADRLFGKPKSTSSDERRTRGPR